MTKQSRLFSELHETVQGLHNVGLIDKHRLQEYMELLPSQNIPKYTSDGVKELDFRRGISP